MAVQLYFHKRNFDTQKVERYLKERRIPYQSLDLAKHRLGRREVELFIAASSPRGILDLNSERVKSHPVAYTNQTQNIIDYILETPALLRCPIVRSGNTVIFGFDEARLSALTQ